MDPIIEKNLRNKIIKQQRLAYEIAKALKTKTDIKVSYIISTKITLVSDKIIPETTIEEFPKTRISHNFKNVETNYLTDVNIENMEG